MEFCAVVESKCAVEKGNACTKKCRDSGQIDDLCADYQVLCGYKSCLNMPCLMVITYSISSSSFYPGAWPSADLVMLNKCLNKTVTEWVTELNNGLAHWWNDFVSAIDLWSDCVTVYFWLGILLEPFVINCYLYSNFFNTSQRTSFFVEVLTMH